MRYLWILMCLYTTCLADIIEPPIASKYTEINTSEDHPTTSTPNKYTPKVDPITGDYIEESIDFVVAGIEALSMRRFYNHLAPYDGRYGSWRINPECHFFANFCFTPIEQFAAFGKQDGSILSYNHINPGIVTFDINKQKSYSNYQLSGQTHPFNTKITYTQKFDPKDKNNFEWHGNITLGDGTKKTFISQMHRWLHHRDVVEETKFSKTKKRYSAGSWTPYFIPIYEEKKPNGNILCYEYETWKQKDGLPRPLLLKSIKAYNSTKTKLLATLQFTNHRDKNADLTAVEAKGSDGRSALFYLGKTDNTLVGTISQTPDSPRTEYHYNRNHLLYVSKPEGSNLATFL